MQFFTHFKTDDNSYVTLRLNKDELKHLRDWMHTPEGERVCFPHGAKLFYRAEGWYRLDTTNNFRAVEKLKTAVAILKSWHRKYKEAVAQEIRLLIVAANPNLQIESYQSDTHNYSVRNKETGNVHSIHQIVKPVEVSHAAQVATVDKLQALTRKFAHR